MEIAPREEPSPFDPADATRELARRMLRLLHHAGLTPDQLAAADDVPYDVLALNRFLAGEELPPRHLVDVVVSRTGGDHQGLWQAYEDAVRAAFAGPGPHPDSRLSQQPLAGTPQADVLLAAPLAGPAGQLTSGRKKRRIHRSRLVIAVLGFSAVGAVTVATTAVAVNSMGNERSTVNGKDQTLGNAAASSAPPARSDPNASTPADPPPGQPATRGNGIELIRNGRFTKTATSWLESDKVRLSASRQRLQVNVAPNSGYDHMGAMVMQYLPEVKLGKDYVLTFMGAAKTKTMITVAVQREMEPNVPTLFTKEAELTPTMRSFSFRFSTKRNLSTPLICFQVGGHPDGHTMWLDSVSLTEQP